MGPVCFSFDIRILILVMESGSPAPVPGVPQFDAIV